MPPISTHNQILNVLAEYAQLRRPEYHVTVTVISMWVTKRPVPTSRDLQKQEPIIGLGWCRPGVLALSYVASHGFLDPLHPTRQYDPADPADWDRLLIDLDELLTNF